MTHSHVSGSKKRFKEIMWVNWCPHGFVVLENKKEAYSWECGEEFPCKDTRIFPTLVTEIVKPKRSGK